MGTRVSVTIVNIERAPHRDHRMRLRKQQDHLEAHIVSDALRAAGVSLELYLCTVDVEQRKPDKYSTR